MILRVPLPCATSRSCHDSTGTARRSVPFLPVEPWFNRPHKEPEGRGSQGSVNEIGLPELNQGCQGTLCFASGQDLVALKPERTFAEAIEAEDCRGLGAAASSHRWRKTSATAFAPGRRPESA